MPQEITRTQIEKYTVYTGPTAESFSPIMAGITYPDPAVPEFLVDVDIAARTVKMRPIADRKSTRLNSSHRT